LGLLLGVTMAGGLSAQSASDFGGLKPGQVVRVRIVDHARFETRLGGMPADPGTDLFSGAAIPFEAARVDSLWVRGRATWTGAIVGAAIATPLSFGFWAFACTLGADGSGCDQWGTVTLLSLAGGAAGAMIGAGVGAMVPKWRLRFARERDLAISPLVTPGRVGVAVRF